MSSYISQFEEAALQSVLPQLEAEGFSVFLNPSKDMLPPFLGLVSPDAVAYKSNRKIAIEVISQAGEEGPKFQHMQKIFADHPDWELRVIYASSQIEEQVIPVLSKITVEEHLTQIESLYEKIGPSAALLTAWAAFEAASRRLLPDGFRRPQSPSRLLETLASEGYITPDEADELRQVSRIRNDVAHGRLDLNASREQVESLIAVTRTILSLGD